MGFTLNPKQMVINELKKIDVDHDGHPDLPPALDKVHNGLQSAIKFAGRVHADEVAAFLKASGKFDEAEIKEIALGISELPEGLGLLDKAVVAVKGELQ